MGMETFFLRRELYEQLYNCSEFEFDEWRQFGTPNIPMGISIIVLGLILQAVYLPFLITMCKERFRRNSCYKLMLYLGIMDFVTLFSSSYISGYLTISGAVFCMYPTLIYFTGLFGFAAWSSACVACMLLTINRCLDIYFSRIARSLFHGYRTWIWMLLPTGIYCRVVLFETPVVYNSSYLSWFFNPYYGMNLSHSNDHIYHSYLHLTVNIITVIVLFVGNIVLCHYVIGRSRVSVQENSFKLQKQFLIQVFVLSMPFFICALFYVYMQFFYSPLWLTLTASTTFIFNSGNAALTYLFLNPTLRRATIEMFNIRKTRSKISYLSHVGGGFSSSEAARNDNKATMTNANNFNRRKTRIESRHL